MDSIFGSVNDAPAYSVQPITNNINNSNNVSPNPVPPFYATPDNSTPAVQNLPYVTPRIQSPAELKTISNGNAGATEISGDTSTAKRQAAFIQTVKNAQWRNLLNTRLYAAMLILCKLTCGVMFVLSCIQTKNVETTPAGSKIYLVNDESADPCLTAGSPFYANRPLRFQFSTDPTDLVCTWPGQNIAMRIVFSLFGIFFPLIGVYGVVKTRKWAHYCYDVISLLMTVAYFWSMCIDSNAVRVSSDWCQNDLQGIEVSSSVDNVSIICQYEPFVMMCLLDAASVLIWAASTLACSRHIYMENQSPTVVLGHMRLHEDQQ